MNAPLKRIPVGVVVERRKATTKWVDYVWQPTAVLAGEPDTPAWSLLSQNDDIATFYAGSAEIELYRTETANYRDNLMADSCLWVLLRPTGTEPPYQIFAVTADPAEGEAYTEAGADLVEQLPMPEVIRDVVAAFVAKHYVEHKFVKRKRDRADPEALGRRALIRDERDK